MERAFKDLYFSFSYLGAISQIPQLTQAGSWLDFGRWISQTENIHLIRISKSPTITRIWIEKLFNISNKEKRNFAGIWEITEGRLWSIIFKEKDKWRGRERQESVLILMENFASPIFIRSSKELEISLFSNNFAQVFATHIFSLAIHIEIQKSNSEIVLGILTDTFLGNVDKFDLFSSFSQMFSIVWEDFKITWACQSTLAFVISSPPDNCELPWCVFHSESWLA